MSSTKALRMKFGEPAELIDVEDILQEATKLGIDRTCGKRIDEALKQAYRCCQTTSFCPCRHQRDPNELRDER